MNCNSYLLHIVIQVMNGAGSVNTSAHTVTLPTVTPTGLAKPTKVQAISPYSIYVEWNKLESSAGAIDRYQVLVFKSY